LAAVNVTEPPTPELAMIKLPPAVASEKTPANVAELPVWSMVLVLEMSSVKA